MTRGSIRATRHFEYMCDKVSINDDIKEILNYDFA